MKLQILGTRGVPAQHGGFETFAEHFAVYLHQKGWQVTVYCQEWGDGAIYEDEWCGVRRVHIPVTQNNAKGTVLFDWKSTLHAAKQKQPILTLGYNTALFCLIYRIKGIKNVINMDGIEWLRGKWSFLERSWLYLNEKFGAWLGNHLIADHPEIKRHLARFTSHDKITVIPYSADLLDTADEKQLDHFEIEKNRYALLVARPEQENLILEIVRAYSSTRREIPLIVLGKYVRENNKYHQEVLDAAGNEIRFVGAIYDKAVVQSLRFFTRLYIHGHTVGGTNPSLVEALGAGSPVLAHNNKFNRWVAGDGACYFSTEEDCSNKLNILIKNDVQVTWMKTQSREQFKRYFSRSAVHYAYEQLLLDKLT
ncbi:MAG: DUF1972 domain-containing protein [Candidatus Electrothrix aestuarii]|uniref:DUF1972 domain-containing protein n=1 Tax=Candidatus Electrothrix aestuarii TaxID=3062594 RepID=A0AAU8LSG2_9BACT|nr:DUF1972 domain-containing protein [Candidatus Electrothrix aestuarii]